MAPTLKGGERYGLYGLNGAVSTAEGGAPESHGQPCLDTMLVETDMAPLKKLQGRSQELPIFIVAVTGGWNAVPRKPKRFLTNQPVYHEAAAAFLREHGIAEPKVGLTQAIRIDLDGDGTQEVLVAGTRHGSTVPRAVKPGDYSFVFLRKLEGGTVRTVPVAFDVHPNPTANSVAYRFDVMAVMDLNGDGAMEIVVQSEYYEGSAAAVFTVEGLVVKQVLIGGCGA